MRGLAAPGYAAAMGFERVEKLLQSVLDIGRHARSVRFEENDRNLTERQMRLRSGEQNVLAILQNKFGTRRGRVRFCEIAEHYAQRPDRFQILGFEQAAEHPAQLLKLREGIA